MIRCERSEAPPASFNRSECFHDCEEQGRVGLSLASTLRYPREVAFCAHPKFQTRIQIIEQAARGVASGGGKYAGLMIKEGGE